MNHTQFYISKEALEQTLRSDFSLFSQCVGLRGEWKTRFINFMIGKKTLPLTYDPFFKCIFNPDTHPERLEQLLSGMSCYSADLLLRQYTRLKANDDFKYCDLKKVYTISLDVFRENGYAKDESALTMWLSLLATESIADAEALIVRYPFLEEIYMEMADYMRRNHHERSE